MNTYYVIHNGEGDTTVTEFISKEKLLNALKENYFGTRECLEELPENDTNYWHGDLLIIKGEIVVPTEKKVVIEFEIK